MKRLYYMRHGETDANARKIWSGQIETPLTDVGRDQAKLAGKLAKQEGLHFDLIICSPLSRAYDTAQIVAEEIGYPVDKIVQNKRFLERTFGVLEGTSSDEFYDHHTYQDLDDVEGAEQLAHLQERAVVALDYLKSRPEDTILVVAHGAIGRAMRRVVEGLAYTHEYTNPFVQIPNAEIFHLI